MNRGLPVNIARFMRHPIDINHDGESRWRAASCTLRGRAAYNCAMPSACRCCPALVCDDRMAAFNTHNESRCPHRGPTMPAFTTQTNRIRINAVRRHRSRSTPEARRDKLQRLEFAGTSVPWYRSKDGAIRACHKPCLHRDHTVVAPSRQWEAGDDNYNSEAPAADGWKISRRVPDPKRNRCRVPRDHRRWRALRSSAAYAPAHVVVASC